MVRCSDARRKNLGRIMEEMAWRILFSGLNRVRRPTVYLSLAGDGRRGAGEVAGWHDREKVPMLRMRGMSWTEKKRKNKPICT